MINLRVRPVDAKRIRISGIEPFFTDCLQGLGEILEQRDSPKVRERLFPNLMTADDNTNADWQRLTAPELRHLFVSAGEIVTRDLTALQPETGETGCSQVTFAADHVNAWMSALNQARLILGEIHEIDEADMNRTDLDPHNPRHVAAFRIHLLGHLLYLFVELENGDAIENPV
jgi:Domain of unknown function (DUF2017)